MEIERKRENDKLTFRIRGKVNAVTAPELEQAIMQEIEEVKELILDMEELEYLSSAGLRVLLSAQKRISDHGALQVMNVNEAIMEIFEVTGFTSILDIDA